MRSGWDLVVDTSASPNVDVAEAATCQREDERTLLSERARCTFESKGVGGQDLLRRFRITSYQTSRLSFKLYLPK